MSREIVPVEFINFLWGILIVLICWPPPGRARHRLRGFAAVEGEKDTTESDRLISKIALFPAPPVTRETFAGDVYTLRTISKDERTHLSSPSAFGGMLIQSSVSEMGCLFHLRNHRSPIFSSKNYRRISTRRKLRPALNAIGRSIEWVEKNIVYN